MSIYRDPKYLLLSKQQELQDAERSLVSLDRYPPQQTLTGTRKRFMAGQSRFYTYRNPNYDNEMTAWVLQREAVINRISNLKVEIADLVERVQRHQQNRLIDRVVERQYRSQFQDDGNDIDMYMSSIYKK